jgi:hypothetical protein
MRKVRTNCRVARQGMAMVCVRVCLADRPSTTTLSRERFEISERAKRREGGRAPPLVVAAGVGFGVAA